MNFLADVSDIFCFFCSGRGKGESRRRRRWGIGFLLKSPGGGPPGREGRGAGRVSAANWGIWGGGAKYFFGGPKCPPRFGQTVMRVPRVTGNVYSYYFAWN